MQTYLLNYINVCKFTEISKMHYAWHLKLISETSMATTLKWKYYFSFRFRRTGMVCFKLKVSPPRFSYPFSHLSHYSCFYQPLARIRVFMHCDILFPSPFPQITSVPVQHNRQIQPSVGDSSLNALWHHMLWVPWYFLFQHVCKIPCNLPFAINKSPSTAS